MLDGLWMVKDDRGRSTPLVRPEDLRDGLSEFQRRELRSLVPAKPTEFVFKMFLMIVVIQAAFAAWRYFVHGWVPRLHWQNIGIGFGVVLTLFLCFALYHWFRKRRSAVGRCLRWNVCAGCGYSLDGSLEESDGCVVCSECGAAWKAWRVGQG